ncbi:LPS export ABC transporter permease LptG [Kushneria sp. Sum13]|uniref:LPS export ABC transporter permease LptG n=1 Tax=Kushneria sp. Sum13 TaxID=3459196 RepID=UPI0040458047
MMFNRLDRYIARNVLMGMLIVHLIILGLDFTISFINDLGDTEGNYGTLQVLMYGVIRLPWRFYQYAPVSVLIGSLVGLGAMASSNELTVMRSAGFSLWRILIGVMKPLLIVVLLVMAVGEFAAPRTEMFGQAWRTELQEGSAVSRSGGWQREGDSFYRFGSIRADNTLLDVNRFRYDGERLVEATHASRAVLDGEDWTLEDVDRTLIQKESTRSEHLDRLKWDTSLDPELLRLIITDRDSQSIGDLWRYGSYLNEQGISANDTWLYFWQKVLLPLTLASLVIIAASFIFGPLRSVAAGSRVFYGTVVGLVFKYVQDLLGPAATIFGFSPIWAIVVPMGACFALGFWLLRRAG